uniref:Uncharacterized protein n=1 Tax=Meloidogyne incognita TaxID=6306 RepID=A0A914LZF6_MELIC
MQFGWPKIPARNSVYGTSNCKQMLCECDKISIKYAKLLTETTIRKNPNILMICL